MLKSCYFCSRIIFPLRKLYLHKVDITWQSQGMLGWRAGPPPEKVHLYFPSPPLTNCHDRFIAPASHELHQV